MLEKMTRDIKINAKTTDADLLAWYNENSGQKPRTKFKNREQAEKMCAELKEAIIELSGPSSKKGAVAKAKKAEKPDGEGTEGVKGRKATAAGKFIHRNVKDNPRRTGTHGYNSFELIPNKGGISYEDYIAQGGRNNDLRYDIEHGFAQLSDSAKPIKITAPEATEAAAE